jgi:hypothetical protein
MTYLPKKPDSGFSPFLDAPKIQTNFSVYSTAFAVNHVAINGNSPGSHNAIILERQTTDPVVDGDFCTLYNKNATSKAGTQPQLFVRIPKFLPTAQDTTKALNTPMQLTYNKVNVAGPIYQSFLPGGYLLFMGSVSGNTAGTSLSIQVILTPAPTALLNVRASAHTLTSASRPMDVSVIPDLTLNDRFVISSAANGSGGAVPYKFTWMAIGTV